ncbi:hypothetical protein SAMN05421507_12829 [Lentzea jiangxiensis]|uniref:Uncharacterized protein n=1 Tax=Lentzea jiangxiensis TaxID=641025 RepID=A0A1H0X175_9PSEU|nr:hypothetical protein SAMN05421507_12829 [Lentzea jiangxiensis]
MGNTRPKILSVADKVHPTADALVTHSACALNPRTCTLM